MTRICIIGNSHCAALKLGWDKLQERFPSIEATFFASPSPNLRKVVVRDSGVIDPGTQVVRRHFEMSSGRGGEIALEDYDHVVVAGPGFSVKRPALLYTTHRSDRANLPVGDAQLVSHACYATALLDIYKGTSGFKLCREIKRVRRSQSVYMLMHAMPDERILNAKGDVLRSRSARMKWNAFREMCRAGDEWLLTEGLERFQSVAQESGVDRVVHQPEATRAGPITTKREYVLGAVALLDHSLSGMCRISGT